MWPSEVQAVEGGENWMVLRHHDGDERSDLIDEATAPRAERAFGAGLVAGALIAAAIVIFIVQNHDSVALAWLGFEWEMPLWIALCGAIVVGMLGHPLVRGGIHRLRDRSERRTQATDELRRAVQSRR